MRYAHASGVATHTPPDELVQPEQVDVVAEEGRLNCKSTFTGEDDAGYIESVETFKYLGRILDRSDNECPDILRNLSRARRVLNWLGKLLWRRGRIHECLPCFI